MNLKEIHYGIEIETVKRTREQIAWAIHSVVGGTVRHVGIPSSYDPWEVEDLRGRVWKVVGDASLTSVPAHLRAEVVSPVLGYDDIPQLQEVVRAIRTAGGKINSQCGIHIHIDAEPFDGRKLGNLAKVVYKQEPLILHALGINNDRLRRYTRPVSGELIRNIERQRPKTKAQLIVIALAFADKPDVVTYGRVSSDLESFLKGLRKLQAKYGLEKADLALCYEAGPTGFVLARRLIGLGYAIIVVAPSLIPRKAGERVKTDRRDARKLADLFRAGLLTAVHIPSVEDEVLRDVCRARTDAVDVRTRARQQLGAPLLRNGYHYTATTNWTQAHMRYLRELVMPNPAQKLVLEEYLQSVDAADEKVKRFEQQMLLMQQDWSRRDFSLALQGFRGFDLVAALTITSELGDLTRFEHPRALMSYLGLVPSEASSGSTRRQGAITKCGNSHVRWMLVEVAHAYRLPPKISSQLSHRQEKLSREVKAIGWRAQNRLNRRYIRLKMRRLHENKIKVAIARELVGFIWELGQLIAGRPTTPRKQSAPERASGVKAA